MDLWGSKHPDWLVPTTINHDDDGDAVKNDDDVVSAGVMTLLGCSFL